MIRRIFFVFIWIPVAILLIALTVANRTPVPVSIDVFNPGNPALTFTAPLFVWLFGAAVIGIIVGGLATWFTQGEHRKKERLYKKEADKLRYEINDVASKNGDAGTSLVMSRQ